MGKLLALLILIAGSAWAQTCSITINPITGLPNCKTAAGASTGINNPGANGIVVCTGTACSGSTAGSLTGDVTTSGLTATIGALKVTNAMLAGSIDISTKVTNTLAVTNGGTGNASWTAYGLIAAGTTGTGALQQVSGLGTSGYVLTSNGAGALPTWQASAAAGYSTVADEGTNLTARTKLNFIGAGVNCVDNSGSTRTDCTISSGGNTMLSQMGDFQAAIQSTSVLRVGANCSASTPCVWRKGGVATRITTYQDLTITAGTSTDTAYVWLDPADGVIKVGSTNRTITCTSGSCASTSVSAFPAEVIPIAAWTATGTAWDVSGGTDYRGFASIKKVTGSGGVTCTTTSGDTDCTHSASTPQIIANGTAALGTSAITSGACATVVSSSGTGIATTDTIQWVFNADPTSTTGYQASSNGMLTIIVYPTSNNANFKVCNNTASSITPGAVTLNWRVTR